MMVEIKVPSPGESVSQVQLATWLVGDGDIVTKDAEIAEIDSDKATLTITAEEGGEINIAVAEGETIGVGTVIGTIDTSVAVTQKKHLSEDDIQKSSMQSSRQPEQTKKTDKPSLKQASQQTLHISPLAKKQMEEQKISSAEILNHFGSYRVTRKDIQSFVNSRVEDTDVTGGHSRGGSREIERQKLSTLRLKLSQRLVAVKNETAMLTTFNEVNMSRIMNIRKQYKEIFIDKFGVSPGLMSFFTKAVTEALNLYPQVNASIDGDEILFHRYADIGIAVSAPKGLVVPVIRNAEALSLAEIEIRIKELADKARMNKLTLEEMSGGTFTITNGGVFGSMLSTPIINPPQSAILGMHNIVDRPVAVGGKVEIHPVMFVALSYDHRIIDGRESVGFLVKVKEMLENPVKMLFNGKDPVEILLNL